MNNRVVIPHWKNLSLKNILEEIDGVLYEEEWKDIEGFESIYKVSSFGRVKSMERIMIGIKGGERHWGCFILSQTLLKTGYTKVGLTQNNISFTKNVHRLVAVAFIPNPENKPEVNHTQGIKNDNRALRLAWNTSSENSQHKYDIGLQSPYWLGKKGYNHPTSKPVNQYSRDNKFIKRWDSASQATIGVGGSTKASAISACCLNITKIVKGKPYITKSAYDFIWKYD